LNFVRVAGVSCRNAWAVSETPADCSVAQRGPSGTGTQPLSAADFA